MDKVLELLNRLLSGGGSIEYAWSIARVAFPQEDLEAAEAYLERERRNIRELPDPMVLLRPEIIEPWWIPGLPGQILWPATHEAMIRDGFPPAAMQEEVHPSSTRILNLLPPPGEEEIRARGLVIGFVQSGKTTSYTSLAAKAADAGYRLVVILAGIHDSLREQTQGRLQRHLIDAAGGQWINLTHDGDFTAPPPLIQILAQPGTRALAVVKKNPARLRRLVGWLSTAGDEFLRNCPVLVIDDEADQASINVGAGRRSTINGLILQLLDRPKAAYVAYTATPFANVLIDPSADDLYPERFIVALPKPSDYFGPETLFGREPLSDDDDEEDLDGLGVVETVPDDEAVLLRPPRRAEDRDTWDPGMPPSLRRALLWFLLATAARRARGQHDHSSMLVHTTMYTDAHATLAGRLREELAALRSEWERGTPTVVEECELLWKDLYRPDLSDRFDLGLLSYDNVRARLGEVLDEVHVVMDNYRATERLSYEDENPATVVAVGGNTLSRGLTLEGLVCSYFVRAASAYDTLMQMGRWFGFRRGYADLPRVWMTADMQDYFVRLATVEAEVRAQVERYRLEHKTPRDFAPRIALTPGLAVTNQAKMRSAVRMRVSYAGERLQTILFNHRDPEWLAANLDATRRLIADATEAGALFQPRRGRDGFWLARDVPWAALDRFLQHYRFHQDAAELRADPIRDFVERQIELGGITSWNVVVAGRGDDRHGLVDLGLPEQVGLLVRSRMNISGIPHANIKSLMSTPDRLADMPDKDDEVRRILAEPSRTAGQREGRIAALRPDGVGLFVLYPIQAESSPQRESPGRRERQRTALDAVDDVIGVGLLFPPCRDTDYEAVEYVVSFTAPPDLEDAEEIAAEELRAADEQDEQMLHQQDAEGSAS